ncbi:GNAT family N-acetyltransferase [Pelomonas sp. SE-A7]|uniref:GNAT family N-acetyltransferase n=1 Tax=Pelomonas sp. SE-A7 TaxID=3054953 RepID=UPI00259CC54C|nr:GNAT family N-acetyltransferase [Pelomonas sp. SE-A7]MDM4766919.1 GNAT family N-acetyltransferase [Pelomonas sp. SE-A7]
MWVLTTERLRLRRFEAERDEDAAFILELLNEPSFLQNIGDRQVRTLDDARGFIENRMAKAYRELGYGFWAVERSADGALLGMCGLVKRDSLPEPDIGYAFVPRAWGQGYALEAARACLAHARDKLGMGTVLGITSPDNRASARVLEGIGLHYVETRVLDGEERQTAVFRWDVSPETTSNDKESLDDCHTTS